MLIAIVISAFFCVVAVLSCASDFVFGKIYFYPTTIISLLYAGYIYLKFSKQEFSCKIKPQSAAIFFIFGAIFAYYLFSAYPTFYPLASSWDGANHIALAQYLTESASHKQMVLDKINVTMLGGTLYNYPWGMHVTVAAISKILNINSFFIMQIVLSLVFASIITSIISYLLKVSVSIYSLVLVLLYAFFTRYTLFYIIEHNYWTQAVGMLCFISLIYYLEFYVNKHKTIIFPIISLTGITLIYPLYAPALFLAFFMYVYMKKIYSLKHVISIMVTSCALTLLYIIPSFADNMARVPKSGPDLWIFNPKFMSILELDSGNSLVVLIVHLILIPVSMYLLKKRRKYYCIFPLMVYVVFLIARMTHLNQYWLAKISYINMLLLIPALALVLDNVIFSYNRILNKKSKIIPLLIFLISIAAFFSYYPYEKYFPHKLKTALTRDEYNMRAWCAQNIGERQVYYLTARSKMGWNEIISKKPEIINAGTLFYKITDPQDKIYTRDEKIALFQRHIRKGAYVLIEKKHLKEFPLIFREKHREGDVLLLEFIGEKKA